MKARCIAAGFASVLVWASGCQEPKEIVPVAPPGLEMQRIPVGPQGEPQAIGETGGATTTKQNTVKADPANAASSPPTPVGQPTKTASGLEYVTLKEGTGEVAKSGQTVTMHYTGTLTDGKKFDSSRDRNEPFVTPLGFGKVIPGWDEGVPGMKVGEVRKLTIPSDLGYGARGTEGIPGGATLLFDVELLGVK